ncbi:hypothetical protein TTHERM_00266700 (macronuclear) [Tetrahymena thermophila SB210]|uniref:Transmembrane protein n=1 Tax=Tetrahymena thermophila (strain SB210) TaxID=312017 RepID=I7M7Q7_TETTS|nr:hypothetical protein TTHERM_00266700 [Tetrahymena thermophila SB210]EAR95659.3 hypothetical protein TTHERM_00266700 [Tetrahymena thermophila SB210]|eukprot:XP_001015904.3 hypothetical protein TTHERM_00266700 [Tetrahymena thermophila SB210]
MKYISIILLITLAMNSMVNATRNDELPLYLAIVAEEKQAHDQVFQFIDQSFYQLLSAFPDDADIINNDFNKLKGEIQSPWQYPDSWHTTVLYIGGDVAQTQTPYYQQFQPGKEVLLESFTFVYVPERIICGPVFPKDVLIANNCPHVTMMMGQWSAVASNYVLEALFTKDGPLQSEYQNKFFASAEGTLIQKFQNLAINNEVVDVYIIKVTGDKPHFKSIGDEEKVYAQAQQM